MNRPVRQADGTVRLASEALDRLMPMHVLVASDGRIARTGPTLAKIHRGRPVNGLPFFDVFAPRRPTRAHRLADICAETGGKFTLRMRDVAGTALTAVAVRCGPGGDVLVNLSFGLSVVEAVGRFGLAGSDFAATDLTLEMLYLVEANTAAMAESRKLNERLHGAKIVAEAEALSDTLTGLRNRRALDQLLRRQIARGTPFTLMHVDLDYFKQVNDRFGHPVGDRVLREVARILLDQTRQDDVVARIGGDEFVLIFNGLTDNVQLRAAAERIVRRLEAPMRCADGAVRISASIGLTVSTDYAEPDSAQMMANADAALYASKARGRACYTFFAEGLDRPFAGDRAAP